MANTNLLHVSTPGCHPQGVFLEQVQHADLSMYNRHYNGYFILYKVDGDRGSTVVKVLCYKLEGRWFDSRWGHWNFLLT